MSRGSTAAEIARSITLPESRRNLIFVFLCLISLVIWGRPLIATFTMALNRDEYTHILLVLPVSAALIVREWRDRTLPAKPGVRAGASLMVLSVLVVLLARVQWAGLAADVRLSLDIVALVTWWIAAFVFCFGTKVCRLLIFPLCFLFWLVPFPDLVLSRVVAWLQHGSSSAAHLLFAAAGVPVVRDGVMLSIPGVTLEVAKECSSIRSSLMLLVTSMVLAQLLLRSPWRKGLVFAAALLLTVAKNGLRIFTIAMLGTRVDPGFLTGRFHHHGGIVFFLIALAAIFVLLWVFRRAEDRIPLTPAIDPLRS